MRLVAHIPIKFIRLDLAACDQAAANPFDNMRPALLSPRLAKPSRPNTVP